MAKWLVIYSRLPFPQVEINVRFVPTIYDQPLEITVDASSQDEAITKANAQVNYQIKGGRVTNSQTQFSRTGSPRIYTMVSARQIRKRDRK